MVYSATYKKHDRGAKNGQIRHFVSANGMPKNPVHPSRNGITIVMVTKRVDKNT